MEILLLSLFLIEKPLILENNSCILQGLFLLTIYKSILNIDIDITKCFHKEIIKIIMKKLLLLCSLLLALSSSHAANINSNFQSTATLQASCSIAADSINFGIINLSSNYQFSSGVTSICSRDITLTITFSTGASNSYSSREMVGANGSNQDRLKYNIYTSDFNSTTPSAHILGDGNNGTENIKLISTGFSNTVNAQIYLFPNQFVTPDVYTDNITVTLSY